MERRITKKVEEHQHNFKNSIKQYIEDNKCYVKSDENDTNSSSFLKFRYLYEFGS